MDFAELLVVGSGCNLTRAGDWIQVVWVFENGHSRWDESELGGKGKVFEVIFGF